MFTPEFSLVLPCYNESKNLLHIKDKLLEVAVQTNGEIILVNNGSTDDTRDVIEKIAAENPAIRLVDVKVNKGYGFGIVSGLREARGTILGYTHADAQTDPLDAIVGFNLVKVRTEPEIYLAKGHRRFRPRFDAIFTIGMGLIESCLFQTTMNDIAAQPTIMHRQMFEKWTNPPSDFSLDLYAYLKGKRHGHVFRFDVNSGQRYEGKSSWNTGLMSRFRLIKRTLNYSFRLRLNDNG